MALQPQVIDPLGLLRFFGNFNFHGEGSIDKKNSEGPEQDIKIVRSTNFMRVEQHGPY